MKKTSLMALALCAPASLALAQGAPAARPAGEMKAPRVAVIDVERIFSDSVLGKSYTEKINALEKEIQTEGTKKQAELTKMDAALKTMSDDLEKQGSVLSPEAADKKRQDLTKKQRERQAFLEDGQADLQRMRERAQAQAQGYQAEFQQKVRPAIEAVAKDRGVDIIVTSQVAMTINDAFDLSKDVIAKSDEMQKTAAAAPAAPKPASPAAAKPAAPAAPTPAPSPKS